MIRRLLLIVGLMLTTAADAKPAPKCPVPPPPVVRTIPDKVLKEYQQWHDIKWPPFAIANGRAPAPVSA